MKDITQFLSDNVSGIVLNNQDSNTSEAKEEKLSKKEKQKEESTEEKRADYFWGQEESIKFMLQMHELGKAWVKISKTMENRSSL